MISLPPSVRIFLATTPTDMRKGHDELAVLVQQQMGQDVYSGHLFEFVSRCDNRMQAPVFGHRVRCNGAGYWIRMSAANRIHLGGHEHLRSCDSGFIRLTTKTPDISCCKKNRSGCMLRLKDNPDDGGAHEQGESGDGPIARSRSISSAWDRLS